MKNWTHFWKQGPKPSLSSNFRPEIFCLRSMQYVLRWKGLVERYPAAQVAVSSGTYGPSPQCNARLQS